jgi:hypothetical protein
MRRYHAPHSGQIISDFHMGGNIRSDPGRMPVRKPATVKLTHLPGPRRLRRLARFVEAGGTPHDHGPRPGCRRAWRDGYPKISHPDQLFLAPNSKHHGTETAPRRSVHLAFRVLQRTRDRQVL